MTAISRRIVLWTALALALVFCGCQESDPSNTPTTPPSATPPRNSPPPDPPDQIIPIGLGGVFVLPETTIRIVEGGRITIYAETDGVGRDFTNGGQFEGIPVRIRHDAPPDQVTAESQVRVGGTHAPGVVHVRALADDVEEPDTTFSLWLEQVPGRPIADGFVLQVDPARLRFEVVDAAPAAPCADVRIEARSRGSGRAAGEFAAAVFGEDVEDYRVADLTLHVAAPSLGVSLAAPYRAPFEHLEDDDRTGEFMAFPIGFALGSRLWDTGEELQQTLSLAHFDDLHLVAESAGCNSVEVSCEDRHCDVE